LNVVAKIEDTQFFKRIKGTYNKYERFAPAIFFMAGFTWDSITIKRIDLWLDNIILLTYIFLTGCMIILVNFLNENQIQKKIILKYQEWYPLAIQFFLGGLFSAYVVLYFQSASFTKNWIFIALLILVLIGNEFIKERLTNLKVQIILYFLALFSFIIFFIPVVIRIMNAFVFIISGILSLFLVAALIYFLYKKCQSLKFKEARNLGVIIIILYFLLNIFYFLNWIPPVPLSLKSGGIYHHVNRSEGQYILKFERGSWFNFWKSADYDFHYQTGDTTFCFAAVFAPTKLNKRIVHEWQYYLDKQETWKTTDRLSYKISGGRDGGYRGFTYKKNIHEGKWRVDVETDEGQLLGRIPFRLIQIDSTDLKLKTIKK
jgi:hypothetical protein